MLIRVIFFIVIMLISSIIPYQDSSHLQYKRRIGLRLPNFLRYKEPEGIHKRRIGLRLPNMLKFKDSSMDPHMEKRRVGMRLPNIIFYATQKKHVLD